jgi:hypothetical protein
MTRTRRGRLHPDRCPSAQRRNAWCRRIDRIGVGNVRLERMPVEGLFGGFPLTIRVDVDHDHIDALVALTLDLGAIPCGAGSATVTGGLLDGTAVGGTEEICARGPVNR